MPRIYSLLLFVLVVLLRLSPAQAQRAAWLRQLPGWDTNSYLRFTTDGAGNAYAATVYRSTYSIWGMACPANTSPYYNFDAALTKFKPDGTVEWARFVNGNGTEYFSPLSVNATGNLTCVLTIEAPSQGPTTGLGTTFGGHVLPGVGRYLIEVTPGGTVLAATALSSTLPLSRNATLLLTDAQDNRYYYEDSTLLRLSSAGVLTTVTTFRVRRATGFNPGATPSFNLYGLALGPQGDLYCTGSLVGRLNVGGGTGVISSDGLQLACVVHLDATGTTDWGIISGYDPSPGGGYNIGRIVVRNAAGELYVTGQAMNVPIRFGNLRLANASYFTLKLSATGQPLWLRGTSCGAASGSCGASHFGLLLDAAGNCYQLGGSNISSTLIVDGTTVPEAGNVHIVSYDPQGALRWVRNLPVRSAAIQTNGGGSMLKDAQDNFYLMVRADVGTQIDQQLVTRPGNTLLRIENLGSVAGTVYLDQNGNGQLDSGEGGFPGGAVVTESNQQLSYTSTPGTGSYAVFGQAGPYALALTPPAHYALTQPTTAYTGTFPAAGQAPGRHFGLQPLPNEPDVRVSVQPYTNVRPGFLGKYRVTVENVGTTTVSGTVSAALDGRLSYVGSVPAGTVAGGAVSWPYTNLAPFGRLSFEVQASLPINVAVGTVLTHQATAPLPGDLLPTDNAATTQQTVTGSLDPNDLRVSHTQLTPQQLAAQQPLDYTIRFQNMGTDTAFTVLVQDTLHLGSLQIGTLQLLAQSHNCSWTLSGHGLLTIRFLNAKLPPRSTNVLASQGFVTFRVRPRPTLQPGAAIANAAHIYFDYNAPLRTNQVTTTVLLPTSQHRSQQPVPWAAYPNPATDQLTVTAALPAGTRVVVELRDALGRLVRQHRQQVSAAGLRHDLDVQALPAGLYHLQLRTDAGLLGSQGIVRQ